MQKFIALVLLIAACLPASLAAKGQTTRITITDVAAAESVIVDSNLAGRFNVWDGPGTFSTVSGRRTEGSQGFIIDWSSGPVASRPNGLRRYEVRFYVRYPRATADQLAYVVRYERDPSSEQGFVYLPGRSDAEYGLNVQAILRGVEGRWFHASREWQEAVVPLLGALTTSGLQSQDF
jgi:hypothetical protein